MTKQTQLNLIKHMTPTTQIIISVIHNTEKPKINLCKVVQFSEKLLIIILIGCLKLTVNQVMENLLMVIQIMLFIKSKKKI